MTRDVLIRIKGLQSMGEEKDDIEVITTGDYFNKKGKHYVIYDEAVEGEKDTIRNTIKISPDKLDIRKSGLASALMSFQPGQKSAARFVTPAGEMLVEINTNQLRVEEQENHLQVLVNYSLDINYDHVSDCLITVDVCSREGARLEL